jgi:hypothetical protein
LQIYGHFCVKKNNAKTIKVNLPNCIEQRPHLYAHTCILYICAYLYI